MPIHDWTLVSPGIFHDFHQSWISAIKRDLNSGTLPPNYYALAEQVAGDIGPDVLAWERNDSVTDMWEPESPNGGDTALVVATSPPKVSITASIELRTYSQKQQTVVIRHSSGDRIVALIEIVSPGKKSSSFAMQKFIEKACESLEQRYHLLILDLHPPTSRDPEGIHGAIWSNIGDDGYRAPPDKPLTLAAYSAGLGTTAYVEPIAVGETLPDMPLFLETSRYINVPLESTYQEAWRSVPLRWRRELDPQAK